MANDTCLRHKDDTGTISKLCSRMFSNTGRNTTNAATKVWHNRDIVLLIYSFDSTYFEAFSAVLMDIASCTFRRTSLFRVVTSSYPIQQHIVNGVMQSTPNSPTRNTFCQHEQHVVTHINGVQYTSVTHSSFSSPVLKVECQDIDSSRFESGIGKKKTLKRPRSATKRLRLWHESPETSSSVIPVEKAKQQQRLCKNCYTATRYQCGASNILVYKSICFDIWSAFKYPMSQFESYGPKTSEWDDANGVENINPNEWPAHPPQQCRRGIAICDKESSWSTVEQDSDIFQSCKRPITSLYCWHCIK